MEFSRSDPTRTVMIVPFVFEHEGVVFVAVVVGWNCVIEIVPGRRTGTAGRDGANPVGDKRLARMTAAAAADVGASTLYESVRPVVAGRRSSSRCQHGGGAAGISSVYVGAASADDAGSIIVRFVAAMSDRRRRGFVVFVARALYRAERAERRSLFGDSGGRGGRAIAGVAVLVFVVAAAVLAGSAVGVGEVLVVLHFVILLIVLLLYFRRLRIDCL